MLLLNIPLCAYVFMVISFQQHKQHDCYKLCYFAEHKLQLQRLYFIAISRVNEHIAVLASIDMTNNVIFTLK